MIKCNLCTPEQCNLPINPNWLTADFEIEHEIYYCPATPIEDRCCPQDRSLPHLSSCEFAPGEVL